MTPGTRKMILTIEEGGVPPHIKPLLAEVVAAIEYGNWGEVSHSTDSLEQLEDAQEELAEALEKTEEELEEVRQELNRTLKELKAYAKKK